LAFFASGPQIKGGGPQVKCGQINYSHQKNAPLELELEMAQKERKKALGKYMLAHIQIPVNFFDLVSLFPGDLKWITDIMTSCFQSGTSTTNTGRSAPRRLYTLWMKNMSKNL
jgi:hypothetical protein